MKNTPIVYAVVGNWDGITEDVSAWSTRKDAYKRILELLPQYLNRIQRDDAYLEVYTLPVNSVKGRVIISMDDLHYEKNLKLIEAIIGEKINVYKCEKCGTAEVVLHPKGVTQIPPKCLRDKREMILVAQS